MSSHIISAFKKVANWLYSDWILVRLRRGIYIAVGERANWLFLLMLDVAFACCMLLAIMAPGTEKMFWLFQAFIVLAIGLIFHPGDE